MLKTYIAAQTKILDLKDRLSKDLSGASLVEYSILIGLITVATISLISAVGVKVTAAWTGLNAAMPTTPAPPAG